MRVAIRMHDATNDFFVQEADSEDGGDEGEVGEDGVADKHFWFYAEGEW